MPHVQVALAETRPAAEALRCEWDELAVALGRPCSAPALLLAWLRHIAPADAHPRIVTVRDRGRLIGLAPLFVRIDERGLPVVRLMGTPSMPQRTGILARPADELLVGRALAHALARSVPRPAIISLERVDDSARWPRALASAWPGRLGAEHHRDFVVGAPVITIGPGGFDAWLAAKSRNFRKDLLRTRRRLAAAGGVVQLVTDGPGLERALAAFARLHGARWGAHSRLWQPDAVAMLTDAGRDLVRDARLRVYTVEIDGTIVAVEILLAAGGEVSSWNTAWDPRWTEERPSIAALHHAIRDCFARGDRRLDLGENPMPYKLRLADGDDAVAWVTVLPRGGSYPRARVAVAPARLHYGARRVARRLPPRARQSLRRMAALPRGRAARP